MTFIQSWERYPAERFKTYVERILSHIARSMSIMTDFIPGLQADIETLALTIPALAGNITQLHADLSAKETALNEEIAKEGVDQETITKLQGELAQVEQLKQQLDPIVSEASSLVPPTPPAEPPAPAEGSVPSQGGAPSTDQPPIETPSEPAQPEQPPVAEPPTSNTPSV